MKLYTEEQAREIIDIAKFNKHLTHDDILKEFSPIELPSDEDVNEQASMYSNVPQEYRVGAKWMKYKILNQKK